MVIANIMNAQNIAVQQGGFSLPAAPQAGQTSYRGRGGAPARKDLEGYEGIGTYGANFIDDGEGGCLVEFNTSVAKRGNFADAYPIRQVPEVFGLTKEGFELAITAIMGQIIADHGQELEDGTTAINFQPVDKSVNINYQDRLNYCVSVAPNLFITVAGLFEPNEPTPSGTVTAADILAMQQRPRDAYMLKLGKKARISNVIEKVDTGLKMKLRSGTELPIVILVDMLEAAPRAHLKGIKLAKMGTRNPAPAAAPTSGVLAAVGASDTH